MTNYVNTAQKYNQLLAEQAEARKQQAQQMADIKNAQAILDAQTEIGKLSSKYRTVYDENAVNQYINERRIAENMANLGLTDSGLNRTQQTAVKLTRGNADLATRLNYESAVENIEQSARDEIAANNLAAAKEQSSIDREINDEVNDRLYAAEIKQAEAAEKEAQKNLEADDQSAFLTRLGNALKYSRQAGISSMELSETVHEYIVRYNLSRSDAELLLTTAGIAPQRMAADFFSTAIKERDRWQPLKKGIDSYLAGNSDSATVQSSFKRALQEYNVEKYGADKLLPRLVQEGYIITSESEKIAKFYNDYIGSDPAAKLKKYGESGIREYIRKQLSNGAIGDMAASYMIALFEYHNK